MLIKGKSYGERLVGTAGADQIYGMEGDDTLLGMGGSDLLDGGTGYNWVDYRWTKAGVTVNLNLTGYQATGGAGSNQLKSIQGVYGSAFADRFTGNAAANKLYGYAGNDWLSGAAGDDMLSGGEGDDQLYGGDGADSMDGGSGADQLLGGAGDDRLDGYSGDDLLDGGAGHDRLVGGGGNNRFVGGDGDDYQTGGGDDDVFVGGAGADSHFGNGGDDVVTYAASRAAVRIDLRLGNNTGGANAGDALFDTYSYIDEFVLTAFNDTYYGSLGHIVRGGGGNDTLIGSSADDVFFGDAGADQLVGGRGVDRMNGGDGADTIVGGIGADVLYGGAGADRFILEGAGDSSASVSDRIFDFGKGDLLDLSLIDANSKLAGDQAFKQVAAFTKTAGQLVLSYDASIKLSTVLLDINGDGVADARILIDGRPEANGSWLVL